MNVRIIRRNVPVNNYIFSCSDYFYFWNRQDRFCICATAFMSYTFWNSIDDLQYNGKHLENFIHIV